MENRALIDKIEKLNEDLKNEHDATKVNRYIERFEPLLKEAKLKWPNIGRFGIIPRPRMVGSEEPEIEAETQMGILKSAAGQLSIMVRRKIA
ncbi:MAG: hypothetical protein QME63_05740 [Actinomycetota bacterium]|nr:hypothetical protein [Actinomycetota bacterium]